MPGAGRIIKLLNNLDWSERTVRQTIQHWQTQGLVGLFDRPRSGRKQRWQEADIAYLEEGLQQEQRTGNSKQLAQKLQRDLRFAAALRYRQIHLSPDRIRRVLKKRGESGSVQELATGISRIQPKS